MTHVEKRYYKKSLNGDLKFYFKPFNDVEISKTVSVKTFLLKYLLIKLEGLFLCSKIFKYAKILLIKWHFKHFGFNFIGIHEDGNKFIPFLSQCEGFI